MASRDGKDSVQRHVGMCEHCITRETKRDANGLGCDSSCRCDVLQLDHCVLTNEEREQAGYAGVLGIVDVATRFTVIVVKYCKILPVFTEILRLRSRVQ